MTIKYDDFLSDFEFWQGGADHAAAFTTDQMNMLEEILAPFYPDGIEKDVLNDIFWFKEDYLANLLGFRSFDDLKEHNEAESLI